MPEQIEVIERHADGTLEIRATAAVFKMPMVIGSSLKKIVSLINEHSTIPSGAPFVRYVNFSWDKLNNEGKFMSFIRMFTRKWEMHIGFPIVLDITPTGEIQKGLIPKGKYVKSIHRGPYKKIGVTYKSMNEWIKKEGLSVKNEAIEFYLNDPRIVKKEDLVTEILIPLKD
jgi:effector-binding domain-containing protein